MNVFNVGLYRHHDDDVDDGVFTDKPNCFFYLSLFNIFLIFFWNLILFLKKKNIRKPKNIYSCYFLFSYFYLLFILFVLCFFRKRIVGSDIRQTWRDTIFSDLVILPRPLLFCTCIYFILRAMIILNTKPIEVNL